MNKFSTTSLLLLFSVLFLTNLQGQNTLELFSLPGLSIASNSSDDTGQIFRSITFFSNDSIIDGVNYLEYHDRSCNSAFYRIDGSKVFQKNMVWNEDETLIYDFGLEIGDTIEVPLFVHPIGLMKIDFHVTSKDIVNFLDNRERIRIRLASDSWGGELEWVEGIGHFNFNRNIECVKDENGSIYLNISEEECDRISCKTMEVDFDIDIVENIVRVINRSENFEEIEWNMGDGSIYTDSIITHEYSEKGCYNILLTTRNSCGNLRSKSMPFAYCVDSLWIAQSNMSFKEISMINELDGYAITENELFETKNSGIDWTPVELIFENDSIQYEFYDLQMKGQYGVISIENNIEQDVIVTDDYGQHWTELKIPDYNYKWRPSVSVDENGNIVLLSGIKVFSSLDNGNTWELTTLERGNTPYAGVLYQGEEGLCVVTLIEQTDISRSIIGVSYDYGRTFTYTVIDHGGLMFGISFVDEIGYITTGSGVLKSEDKGLTWNKVYSLSEYLNFRDVYFSDKDNGILISISNTYRTMDGGITWDLENCQNNFGLIRFEIIDSIEFIRHTRGILKYQPEDDFNCVTSTHEISEEPNVSVFPNPSNDRLFIKDDHRIIKSIKLFSIHGVEMSKEQYSYGPTSIDISNLPSGVYVIRIQGSQKFMHSEMFIKN